MRACPRGCTPWARPEAECLIVALVKLAGMTIEEATATAQAMFEHEFGCAPAPARVGSC
jgi:hypothetical protein